MESDEQRSGLTRRSALGFSGAALAVSAVSSTGAMGASQARASATASSGNSALPLGGVSVKAFGAMGDSDVDASGGTDDTAAIQSAIDYLGSVGGGTLFFPEGCYRVSSYLRLCANLRILGAGRCSSVLVTSTAGGGGATNGEGLRNGSIFYSSWPSNSSTAAEISVEHLGIHCSNPANFGAAFYDNCGTYISLRHVAAWGFKHCIVFDQTEVSDITECNLSPADNGGACVWFVNGDDLTPGNRGGFTNRVGIAKCQLNAGHSCYGILDDGGNAHAFTDNNYNGCRTHIRAAGVAGLRIVGGEFESAAAECIRFDYKTMSGAGCGQCVAVYLGGGAEIIPSAGQHAVCASSLGNIVIDSAFFGSSSATKFTGAGNCFSIYAIDAWNAGGGKTFDRRATHHFEIGSDGTEMGIRTNMAFLTTGGIGYAKGAAGKAVQASSKSSPVRLDELSGRITLDAEALAPSAPVSFTLTNSLVDEGDLLILNHVSGGTPGAYQLNAHGAAEGSVTIDVTNVTSAPLAEAIVIGFAVIKACAA